LNLYAYDWTQLLLMNLSFSWIFFQWSVLFIRLSHQDPCPPVQGTS
jgi:hypothetical protein